MIANSCAAIRSLLSYAKMQASFYKTVNFFTEVEGTASHSEKEKAINAFRSNLSEAERREFEALMMHINKKVKIGVTTKVVNSYYLKKYVPQSNEHASLLLDLAEGGLANRIGTTEAESDLTLYDVNIFLKYIAGVSGAGSQAQKSQKIIDTVSAISKKQGIYFLKLIDHKITIGAKEKTFKNAKKSKEKEDEATKTRLN